MNTQKGVAFLFTIATEVQHSFTSPVIFFTLKDFAENIFTAFTNMHNALLKQEPTAKIAEIVKAFHTEWLDAILDVERFSNRIKDTPREVVLKAIDYTMDCLHLRYKHIQEYTDEVRTKMTVEENQLMQVELKIIKDLEETVRSALVEKKQYIQSQADQTEYLARIQDETDELLHWLDKLNDCLAIEFCKLLSFKVPLEPSRLTKTSKSIINEVAMSNVVPEAKRVAELIHVRSHLPTSADRIEQRNDLEIAQIIEKIKALEVRINRLKNGDSPVLMALKHKIVFLEDRLQSLENIKMSISKLRRDYWEKESDEKLNFTRTIFNHLLPHQDRCRLVEKLTQIWNTALTENIRDQESIIDILSVAKVKEVYSDEIGKFTVDKFGRKIYKTGEEDIFYQLNENNILVPLSDDEKHIYFYDACGRYYINSRRERVYKHHDGASEYMLSKEGFLVKVLEVIDGIEYCYDGLGRYYVNAEGRHIYRDEDSNEEYEQDGFGNLVKVHEESLYFGPCHSEPITTEENKYLKREVGDALKKCIAEVVLHQPTDPVIYLADLLTKYSDNIKAQQKHLQDEQERFDLSQLIHRTKDNLVNPSFADEATEDVNFTNYQHETDLSSTSF